ncbi:unnamed protein product [Penicillium salamii]|uniref:Uncharacterized protein n=1 Tax=Penicillium salamii TaxID=1612424 RepID=A0A9W4NTW4_9EURO|nr:unnamed protein product [Penicillium salamii]CAG8300596.1 unnamed protein product [Penicillium salamii]CAG8353824.1 unnamed protein product [Penicillium salamii]CAG8359783.1 unnamed protein product [Penicillium salamii]CAG8367755.1 unnamed protein product [Penicillium salamii]
MISPNMDSRTMPMPRDSNQVIPSFRELEAKVEANMLEDKGERLRRGEGKGDIVYVDNPFPPYPLQGSRIPPDPSHNYPVRLPLRAKEYDNIPTNQQPPSPNKRALPPPRLQVWQSYSPRIKEAPSPSPCSTTTEKQRPDPQPQAPQPRTRKHKAEAPESNRHRLRKISVQFTEVAAHTAKCDECNKRNQSGMSRCKHCGWQICNQCKNDRGGDQSHASFGAIHVPEIGGDVLDGAHDRRVYSSPELEAAKALVQLASDARRFDEGLERFSQRQEIETDSDMTLSVAGDEWTGDDPEVAVDDHGRLLGYFIARRNPSRAARPSSKLTE